MGLSQAEPGNNFVTLLNFVSGGKLVVFDAAGLNPIAIVDSVTNVANGAVGDHVLIASATFPSHTTPAAVPDFTMANLIPASYFAAGSLCWESNAGTIFWRLSWGGAAYTGSNLGNNPNDHDGNFGPPFDGAFLRAAPARCNSREAPLICNSRLTNCVHFRCVAQHCES